MVVTQKPEPEIKIDDLETERTQHLKETGTAKPSEPLWAIGKGGGSRPGKSIW